MFQNFPVMLVYQVGTHSFVCLALAKTKLYLEQQQQQPDFRFVDKGLTIWLIKELRIVCGIIFEKSLMKSKV